VNIKFKRLSPNAILPTRAHPTDAGLDLYAVADSTWWRPEYCFLHAGRHVVISTGWAIEIPVGYDGQIRPRSGLALKHGVTVLNAPGTIDSSYRGEIKVVLVNHSCDTFCVDLGAKIAQLVIAKVELPSVVEADELSTTERDAAGFGSTGR